MGGGVFVNYVKILSEHDDWFIQCLILVEVGYSIIYLFLPKWTDIILFLISLTLFLMGYTQGTHVLFHTDTAVYAMIFFIIGKKCKDLNLPSCDFNIPKSFVVIGSILYIIVGDLLFLSFPFNTSLNEYNDRFILIMMNIIGILLLVLASKTIPHNKSLSFLGRNSLMIYLIHIPFVYYIYMAFLSFTRNSVFDSSICNILYCCVICMVLYPIISFLNNRFPVLTGKGKLIQNMASKM